MLNLQTKRISFEELKWPLIYTIDSENESLRSPFYPLDSCHIHEKWIQVSTKAFRINKSAMSYDANTFSNT